jgi:flagellar export protein FliJ
MGRAVGTFRFSLQPALDAAAARERDAGVAHGRARACCDAAAGVLALLDARSAQARALRASVAPAESPALLTAVWIATDFYLERVRDVRTRGEAQFAAARLRVTRARERFEFARREHRALELLRERRLAGHRARVALREGSELDESNALAMNVDPFDALASPRTS